ncbi:MAG: hypothetical protein FWD19_00895, partial [Defluviitaleaceae bacterium]|nr:hypothetical protein [Defluviitaleaceae bacterium]
MKKAVAIFLAGLLFVTAIFIFPFGKKIEREEGNGDAQVSERVFSSVTQLSNVYGENVPIALNEIDGIVSSQEPRDGFILAPTKFGLTGIDATSAFV